MTKRERMNAFLKGEAVDRPPVSFWRHFYPDETTPEGLANAMLTFQDKFDWDFMKVNPRASYHAEALGSTYAFPKQGTKTELAEPAVQTGSDWSKLRPVSPREGVLGDHVRALEMIGEKLAGDVHFIQTIFTPLSIAMALCSGQEQFLTYLRERPAEIRTALEIITETFANFAEASISAGADGIFLATTQMATTNMLGHDEYQEFGRAYDLEILRPIRGRAELLLLHVCKGNNMLLELLDYPVHMFNWDATDSTNPTISKVRHLTDKCIIGGVDHKASFADGNQDKALGEAADAFEGTGGKGWALGAGCTIPMDASQQTLRALRDAVENMKS